MFNKSGGMTGDMLLKVIELCWLSVLIEAGMTPENPFVFFCDGHGSRLNIAMSKKCREWGLIIYAGIPHSTHLWQPHDTVSFGIFKSLLRSERVKVMQWLSKTFDLGGRR